MRVRLSSVSLDNPPANRPISSKMNPAINPKINPNRIPEDRSWSFSPKKSPAINPKIPATLNDSKLTNLFQIFIHSQITTSTGFLSVSIRLVSPKNSPLSNPTGSPINNINISQARNAGSNELYISVKTLGTIKNKNNNPVSSKLTSPPTNPTSRLLRAEHCVPWLGVTKFCSSSVPLDNFASDSLILPLINLLLNP